MQTEDNAGFTRVSIENSEREIGLSGATFRKQRAFTELLRELSLDCRHLDSGRTSKYVWHNDDVLLVTQTDPTIDGEAGLVGIEGEKRSVYWIFSTFTHYADYDDVDFKQRSFI